MMKGKQGNIMLGITIGFLIWITGILFLPFLTTDITTSRNASHLDCTNLSISDGTKLTCLEIDAVTPLAIWMILSLSIGLIVGGMKS